MPAARMEKMNISGIKQSINSMVLANAAHLKKVLHQPKAAQPKQPAALF